MCCEIDVTHTENKLKKLRASQVSITGYKVLTKDGKTPVTGYQYNPGTYQMLDDSRVAMDNYDELAPRGFHFYTTMKAARYDKGKGRQGSKVILKVSIPVADIVGLQTPGTRYEQGVSNSLFISKQAWKDAGLKLPKGE